MASLYPPGVDNPRRTHENAIKRMERFTQSDKFNQLNLIELETHLTMFDKSFADFTSEHEKLIVKLKVPANFKLEDEFYATIQELYRSSVIKFRKQMDKVERETLLRSMARRSRDGARVRTVISGEQQIKPQQSIEQDRQQQQRDYEREQRHQHIVQRNDAAIHKVRTRDWVNSLPPSVDSSEMINQLPIDMEEAELERKRREISNQLAKLDRKQRELDERANQLKPVSRERSRSPNVQFRVSIPSTSQMAQREIHCSTLSNTGANTHNQMESTDLRNRLYNREREVGVGTLENTSNRRSVAVTPHPVGIRDRIGSVRSPRCHFCGEAHKMYQCPRFNQLKRAEREQHVGVLKLCKNCFMPLEDGRHRCRFGRCENCGIGKFHNSLLCPVRYPDNDELY